MDILLSGITLLVLSVATLYPVYAKGMNRDEKSNRRNLNIDHKQYRVKPAKTRLIKPLKFDYRNLHSKKNNKDSRKIVNDEMQPKMDFNCNFLKTGTAKLQGLEFAVESSRL